MRIEFRGFGRNVGTVVLALILASLLAGAFTFLRPMAVPGHDTTAGAAVYPCQAHATYYKWVTNQHGGPFWTITIRAEVAYNGCDVWVPAGTQRCSWSAWGYSIASEWCGNYRQYTYTAYGQNLVIGGYFNVYVMWYGFPVSAQVHLCQWYNRNGGLINTQNGPYGSGC